MRIRGLVAFGLSLVVLGATPAAAQDSGKVGISMGYPASIGVLWRASDKVAIRPELSISGGTSDVTSSSFESESDGWAIGTGVSALFYLHRYDHLRTYFSPRFTYSRTTNNSTLSSFTNSESKTTNKSAGAAGSFGAEYSLGEKFAVFGEVGFGFNHTTANSSTSPSKVSGNTWGSRTGVGVIFFP